MSEVTDAIIQRAISEAKTGNREAAKKSLSEVVRQEPNNARAWYLLSQVVEKEDQSIYCLNQVLKLQPNNLQAQSRLLNHNAVIEQQGDGYLLVEDERIKLKSTTSIPPKKKSPIITGITKWVIAVIIAGGILLCIYAGFTLINLNQQSSNSVDTQAGSIQNQNIIQTESPQNWVIYEVKYVNNDVGFLRYHASVDMTWENNTGGTEQGTYTIGDGLSHTYKSNSGKTVTEQKPPFRAAYQMGPGDFSYISAQNDENYNQLICSIYVSDEIGETCLVHQGTKCGKIVLWKTAQCSGKFCICSASGIFGIP